MDKIKLALQSILDDHKAEILAKKLGEGIHPSTLYRWAESGNDEVKPSDIPLRRAIQLTLIAGDPRLMMAIADEAGGIFLPRQHLVEGKFKDEHAALKVLKEAAELIEKFTNAITDKRITFQELKSITKEGMQAHMAIACILERAKEMMDKKL